MEIDLTLLITKASNLVHDGMMDMAARGEVPVQELYDEEGRKYQLSVVLTRID